MWASMKFLPTTMRVKVLQGRQMLYWWTVVQLLTSPMMNPNSANWMTNFAPEKHYIELADGTRSNSVALKRGDVEVTIMDTTGKCVNATLKNALYIPTYPQNIFSVQAATEKVLQ